MIEEITEFFAQQMQAFGDWVYSIVVEGAALFIELSTYYSLKGLLWSIQFSSDVAQQIIADLQLNQTISQYWALLPPDVLGLLNYLAVPQGFQIILSASVTRFVMGKVGVLA